MKEFLKKNRSTVILLLVFFIGLSVLLYPTVSNFYNSFRQSRVIESYTEQVEDLSKEDSAAMLSAAQEYNERLALEEQHFRDGKPKDEEYKSLLNVNGDGMMGYIVIDRINVRMPIYHGTASDILGGAAGHLEGSSLPVGGEGTHTVLTGHRGLPSSRLFTDLDQLEEGDTFTLYILGEVLTYQVDQIRIVEPDETEELKIEEGEDYCTLVTCTPYGINTHRILVRGTRIPTPAGTADTAGNAIQIEPLWVASVIMALILMVLLILVLLRTGKHRK